MGTYDYASLMGQQHFSLSQSSEILSQTAESIQIRNIMSCPNEMFNMANKLQAPQADPFSSSYCIAAWLDPAVISFEVIKGRHHVSSCNVTLTLQLEEHGEMKSVVYPSAANGY